MAFGINEDLNGIKVGTILYEALYCSCIHESSFGTLSIHLTEDGAIDAMERHKEIKRQEFDLMFPVGSEERDEMEFGQFEEWAINPIEVHL